MLGLGGKWAQTVAETRPGMCEDATGMRHGIAAMWRQFAGGRHGMHAGVNGGYIRPGRQMDEAPRLLLLADGHYIGWKRRAVGRSETAATRNGHTQAAGRDNALLSADSR